VRAAAGGACKQRRGGGGGPQLREEGLARHARGCDAALHLHRADQRRALQQAAALHRAAQLRGVRHVRGVRADEQEHFVREVHGALALVQQEHLQPFGLWHAAMQQEITELRDVEDHHVRRRLVNIVQLANGLVEVLVRVELEEAVEQLITRAFAPRPTPARNLANKAHNVAPL
jgi:hypothetical protein